MKGLDVYKTKDGFVVARLHYSVDDEKSNPKALLELEKGYPGGRGGSAWRKEMEIDFTAYSGQLLCYQILQRHRDKIVKERKVEYWHHKYGSMDWGRNNPASFHVYAVDDKMHIHSLYEVYVRDHSIPKFCEMMKAAPFYNDLEWISADPSMWNRNQETKEGLKSLYDMFTDEDVFLRKGVSRDDALAINELLDRWDNLNEREPTFTISPKCHKQVWEFERLRYKEITTAMVEKANPHESLVDKDNHSWDDFKYFISTLLMGASKDQAQKIPRGSVAWEMMQEEIEADDWRKNFKEQETWRIR